MDGGKKPTDGLTNNNSWRSSWVSMELHKTKRGEPYRFYSCLQSAREGGKKERRVKLRQVSEAEV